MSTSVNLPSASINTKHSMQLCTNQQEEIIRLAWQLLANLVWAPEVRSALLKVNLIYSINHHCT